MKRIMNNSLLAFFLFFTFFSVYGKEDTLKLTALFENDQLTNWTAFLKKSVTTLQKEITYDSSKNANTVTFEIPFTESYSGTITLKVENSDNIPVDFIYPGTQNKRIDIQYFRLSYIHMLEESPEYFLSADGRVFREQDSNIAKFLLETEIDNPVLHPAGGTYFNEIEVVITTKSNADIVYTTNGENPAAEYVFTNDEWELHITKGTKYTDKIKVLENNTTIISQAYKRGLAASGLASEVYELKVSALKIEPPGAQSHNPIEVVIKMTGEITKQAKIIYTTDGTAPALNNGNEYTGKIILNQSATIKAKAFKTGFLPAEEVSATFTITES